MVQLLALEQLDLDHLGALVPVQGQGLDCFQALDSVAWAEQVGLAEWLRRHLR